MASISTTPCHGLAPSEGYRLWANSYDRESNPMLSLEQRILEPLLPPLAGLDVVDLGCGTGRRLESLKTLGARSLLGIDQSPEMLSLARTKLGAAATFLCSDCATASIPRASADIVFANFVLSYIDDERQLLAFARRALRPGGFLLLSDVHPQTAAALNWRRGVRAGGAFQPIRTYQRRLGELIALCRELRLQLRLRLEPGFGEPERLIFQENGKSEYFEQIRNYPAIYLLQFCAISKERKSASPREITSGDVHELHGARFALGPGLSVRGEMRIRDARVDYFCQEREDLVATATGSSSGVALSGYLVLPGLINAHDHLEFALFPRLGEGGYRNFLEWAEDIHRSHAAEIARHRQVPKSVRLWWGGIRNLLCGVTTVCHHNPYEPEVFSDGFIVRVLRHFGWAHSLALDPVAARKKKATAKGQPFFIHLAEGTDQQCSDEIFQLDHAGALDSDTIVIHGLGLGTRGSALLRTKNAGLIWCPSSNHFLFGSAMSAGEIRTFPKVALGSDSPLTAQGDLLDEVHYAHNVLQTPAAEIYQYVTHKPARLLGVEDGEGAFRVGSKADLIAVRDTGSTPADTLSALSYRDIELVLLAGRVQLASPEMKKRLSQSACDGLQPLSVEGTIRWIRAPLERLFNETFAHLSGPIYLGGKQVSFGA